MRLIISEPEKNFIKQKHSYEMRFYWRIQCPEGFDLQSKANTIADGLKSTERSKGHHTHTWLLFWVQSEKTGKISKAI